jgi:integrase/recombinase XerD
MLGHVELSTTQIYTQVSIRRLKAVHAFTHPSAKIDRPTKSATTAASDEAPGDSLPLVAHSEHDVGGRMGSSAAPSTTHLLAALDAEADEEHADEPLES